tara:strand:- start:459 stop:1154 length:696 start_codon:yes stop_codon:yes gene_type:complete
MKIVALSDIHGNLFNPNKFDLECDILIIAGDICPTKGFIDCAEFQANWLDEQFRNWLYKIPARHIIGIAGNHDRVWEDAPSLVPKDLPWTYLQDDSIVVEDIKIWGSPWTNFFCNWAFNLDKDDPDETKLHMAFEQIPEDADIIVTHGPPFGILDQVGGVGDHLGSVALRENVFRVKPKFHFYGHIHSGCNMSDLSLPDPKVMEMDGITFANVSLLNEPYKMVYKPFVAEI